MAYEFYLIESDSFKKGILNQELLFATPYTVTEALLIETNLITIDFVS